MPINDLPQLQAIQQLGRTYRAFMAAFEANIGQSMPRWRILLNLHQAGELSQKELALRLRTDPGALTRQIKAIESLGWVQRHNDAKDNRLTNVALTAQGKKVVEETLPRRTRFVENAFGDLSLDEVNALGKMLRTLELHLLNDLAAAQAEQPVVAARPSGRRQARSPKA